MSSIMTSTRASRTVSASSSRQLSLAEMEQLPGIKAQKAVKKALEGLGWKVKETPISGELDRQGVDLILRKGDTSVYLDVSFRFKPGRTNTLEVKDWMFHNPANGLPWTFKREYIKILEDRLQAVVLAAKTGRLDRTA